MDIELLSQIPPILFDDEKFRLKFCQLIPAGFSIEDTPTLEFIAVDSFK